MRARAIIGPIPVSRLERLRSDLRESVQYEKVPTRRFLGLQCSESVQGRRKRGQLK
jgi:hypothetical protein